MRFIPLFSGSSGNSSLLDCGETKLLIDAGLTGKAVSGALSELSISPTELSGILITHDHIDHTKAVGILSRKYNLPVYANAATWEAMQPIVKEIAFKNVRLFRSDQDFYIGNVNITPFRTPHDAAESVGFTFFEGGKKLLYMTDIGCVQDSMFSHAEGCSLVFVEANHDIEMLKNGPYPYVLKQRILSTKGHLSNESCGKLLSQFYSMGIRFAVLGHLSSENNTPSLALETVSNVLAEDGITDFNLTVAKRSEITGIFEI